MKSQFIQSRPDQAFTHTHTDHTNTCIHNVQLYTYADASISTWYLLKGRISCTYMHVRMGTCVSPTCIFTNSNFVPNSKLITSVSAPYSIYFRQVFLLVSFLIFPHFLLLVFLVDIYWMDVVEHTELLSVCVCTIQFWLSVRQISNCNYKIYQYIKYMHIYVVQQTGKWQF